MFICFCIRILLESPANVPRRVQPTSQSILWGVQTISPRILLWRAGQLVSESMLLGCPAAINKNLIGNPPKMSSLEVQPTSKKLSSGVANIYSTVLVFECIQQAKEYYWRLQPISQMIFLWSTAFINVFGQPNQYLKLC